MNRIDWFYKLGEALTSTYLSINYTVRYEGMLPKNGPYVMLPNHQKLLDIPSEGHFIRRQTGRLAYFVMRGFPFPFNAGLEALGGIKVSRPKDIRKGKISKDEAHEINERATKRVLEYLENGEPVVIHPGGTREHKEIYIHKASLLGKIVDAQKEIGQVPFIAVKIKYAGNNIRMTAGKPFYTNETSELEEHLRKELSR